MAISLKHTFQSAKADGADTTLVQPSNWNAEHTITCATGKVLGRVSAGTGAVEEIAAPTGAIVGTTDAQTLTNKTITAPTLNGNVDVTGSLRSGITAVSASAIDCTSGNFFTKTVSGALSWTISNGGVSRFYGITRYKP